ncbi:hypothetical protein WICPIJ_009574 [Wickerhamomyces pijperi]|uniref:Tf2-1-like SH3-like domain-containing protein n=1 Tax=Wickerhamomyces pijperi TaxID=599730 RepID=A0A9P8PMV1_WICPI|nr:hypothetical protein WICPIJ_009574 [Wickerhamomyces pijperi]
MPRARAQDSPSFSSTWNLDVQDHNAETLAKEMAAIIAETKDHLVEAQRAQELQHNKKHQAVNYKVGDWVLIRKDVWGIKDKYSKLENYYIGPYCLVKDLGENAFKVALPDISKKQRTINVEYFKPFVEKDTRFPKQPPRTHLEIVSRLHEITNVVGISLEAKTLSVTWAMCDPRHVIKIPFTTFNLLKDRRHKQRLVDQAKFLLPRPETIPGAPS